MIHFFRNSRADSSPVDNVQNQYEISNYTVVPFSSSIVHNVYNVNTNFRVDLYSWTLFFYGSKYEEEFGAGYVLIDPKGTKIMISCRLEFECTNNVAEYEALFQGLRKASDFGAQVIECYGDSKIIVKQVRNKIHCISPHLVNYHKLVWDMTNSFKGI